MKTEKKPTKNVVISERDYKNLVTAARVNDRLKQHVRNFMSTDMSRAYNKLIKEHGKVKYNYYCIIVIFNEYVNYYIELLYKYYYILYKICVLTCYIHIS